MQNNDNKLIQPTYVKERIIKENELVIRKNHIEQKGEGRDASMNVINKSDSHIENDRYSNEVSEEAHTRLAE